MEDASLLQSSEKKDIHAHYANEQAVNPKQQSWPWKTALLLHFMLTLVYVAVYIEKSWNIAGHGRCPSTKHDLPAAALLEVPLMTKPKVFHTIHNNPFAGRPNASIDDAWHNLLEPISIRVSKEELERTKQTSVELPEGGGYLSWVGAYHELHCLKAVRQWTYREHYFPNVTADEKAHWELHSDHCIEYLRQAAMCHGDTSLTVFEWNTNKSRPVLSPRRQPHTCIDWDHLVTSLKHRVISNGEFARLENPLSVEDQH